MHIITKHLKCTFTMLYLYIICRLSFIYMLYMKWRCLLWASGLPVGTIMYVEEASWNGLRMVIYLSQRSRRRQGQALLTLLALSLGAPAGEIDGYRICIVHLLKRRNTTSTGNCSQVWFHQPVKICSDGNHISMWISITRPSCSPFQQPFKWP